MFPHGGEELCANAAVSHGCRDTEIVNEDIASVPVAPEKGVTEDCPILAKEAEGIVQALCAEILHGGQGFQF